MATNKKFLTVLMVSQLVNFTLTGCEFVQTTNTTSTPVSSQTSNQPSDFSSTPLPDPAVTAEQPVNNTQSSDLVDLPQVIDFIEGITLVNAEPRTSSSVIEVQLMTLNRNKMKLGFDAQCADGNWESYNFSRMVTVPQNQVVTVSVQFMDWDGNITPCYKKTFIQDSTGPDILFQRYPTASLEEGTGFSLVLLVTDSLSSVSSVKCEMSYVASFVPSPSKPSPTSEDLAPQVVSRSCLAGASEINITSMSSGSYTFSVQANDELGNSSQNSVSWSVVSTTRGLVQDVLVNDYKKVDVLFVIDNSGSMAYEQKSMAQRTSNFLSVLHGLDWQIAVTTTDPRNVALGDGNLIPITGLPVGSYVLNSQAISESSAQTLLSNTLQRKETGSGIEQGVNAVYRMIEKYNAGSAAIRSFLRSGAQLAVVLISDEDESANTVKNDPNKLIELIHNMFDGQKRFSFHSIITRPGDSACLKSGGATFGERYNTLSQLTGGLVGSVCEMDYSAQVNGIAQGVRDLLKTLTLQCEPLQNFGITVTKNGAVVSAPFKVEGVNLKFDQELDPGQYQVIYRCLK